VESSVRGTREPIVNRPRRGTITVYAVTSPETPSPLFIENPRKRWRNGYENRYEAMKINDLLETATRTAPNWAVSIRCVHNGPGASSAMA